MGFKTTSLASPEPSSRQIFPPPRLYGALGRCLDIVALAVPWPSFYKSFPPTPELRQLLSVVLKPPNCLISTSSHLNSFFRPGPSLFRTGLGKFLVISVLIFRSVPFKLMLNLFFSAEIFLSEK